MDAYEQSLDNSSAVFEDAIGAGIMATSQVPGLQVGVLWEDDENGVRFGIPSARDIEMTSHKRIAEITYRFVRSVD